MAIAFRNAVTKQLSSVNSFSINVPTGLTDGDFVLIGVEVSTGATVTAAPAGFTQVTSSPITFATNRLLYVYQKIASGEGASWSFTLSGFVTGVAWDAAWSGTSLSIDQQNMGLAGTASSANVVVPDFTTTKAGMVIEGVAVGTGTATVSFTPPGTFTERADVGASGVANGATAAELAQGAGGSVGAQTFVANGVVTSNNDAAYFYVNIYEPAVGSLPNQPGMNVMMQS